MSMNDLDEKVKKYKELVSLIEILTSETEAIKDAIKLEMADRGSEELSGDGWKATWHTVTSNRLDSAALKKAEPELYESFCRPSTVCRFCLK